MGVNLDKSSADFYGCCAPSAFQAVAAPPFLRATNPDIGLGPGPDLGETKWGADTWTPPFDA